MRTTPPDPVLTLSGQWWGCHARLAESRVGFNRTDAASRFGEEFQAHVAAAFGLFVALFGQYSADQADQRGAAGEDADDVGAAVDLFVQSHTVGLI
jgi:hypothetical protein